MRVVAGIALVLCACGWNVPLPSVGGDANVACDSACVAGPNAQAACVNGQCVVTCNAGFVNCDGNPSVTGCDISSATGCQNCDPAAGGCNTANGFACQSIPTMPLVDGGTFRCCHAMVACGVQNCTGAMTCLHATDFDLCCAMGGP